MTEQNRLFLVAFLNSIDLDDIFAEEIEDAGGLANYMFNWLYADAGNRASCEADGFPSDKIMPILNMVGALELTLKMANQCRAEYDEEEDDFNYDLARERACYERGF
jgi:hypothetical protein